MVLTLWCGVYLVDGIANQGCRGEGEDFAAGGTGVTGRSGCFSHQTILFGINMVLIANAPRPVTSLDMAALVRYFLMARPSLPRNPKLKR
jgi:hypothetical protein